MAGKLYNCAWVMWMEYLESIKKFNGGDTSDTKLDVDAATGILNVGGDAEMIVDSNDVLTVMAKNDSIAFNIDDNGYLSL